MPVFLMCIKVFDCCIRCEDEIAFAVVEGVKIIRCAAAHAGYLTQLSVNGAVLFEKIERLLRCADVKLLIAY